MENISDLLKKLFPPKKQTFQFPYDKSDSMNFHHGLNNWGSQADAPGIFAPIWEKVIKNHPELSCLSSSPLNGMYNLASIFNGESDMQNSFSGIVVLDGKEFPYKLAMFNPGKEPGVTLKFSHQVFTMELSCKKWDMAYRKFDYSEDRTFTLEIRRSDTNQEFSIIPHAIIFRGPVTFSSWFGLVKKPGIIKIWWRTHYDKYELGYPKGDNSIELQEFWPFVNILQLIFLEPLGLKYR
ncbi:MAG: hypothetical protein JWM20_336 [Patescibacteria group bacterium]|nr:hypothetical protein [Patescibacteria group bacterium]